MDVVTAPSANLRHREGHPQRGRRRCNPRWHAVMAWCDGIRRWHGVLASHSVMACSDRMDDRMHWGIGRTLGAHPQGNVLQFCEPLVYSAAYLLLKAQAPTLAGHTCLQRWGGPASRTVGLVREECDKKGVKRKFEGNWGWHWRFQGPAHRSHLESRALAESAHHSTDQNETAQLRSWKNYRVIYVQ